MKNTRAHNLTQYARDIITILSQKKGTERNFERLKPVISSELHALKNMPVRSASHAGSWYSSSPYKLGKQLDEYLARAPSMVHGARFLIGPHAGFAYAGAQLAETYNAWDTSKVKRVFILGPSHHVYFKNYAYVSGFDEYETPFGNLRVDTGVIRALVKHDVFKVMDQETDEDEHSFEMHAPYVHRLTENLSQGQPSIVPIMISHTSEAVNAQIAEILSEYLKHDENTFVISSDFCHWGSRFGYTTYTPSGSLDDLVPLRTYTKVPPSSLKIHQSIEYLDTLAASVASTGSSQKWKEYINETKNTICGQRPFSILLEALEIVRKSEGHADDWALFKWIGYSQSSQVTHPSDSSVSYYSGYATDA